MDTREQLGVLEVLCIFPHVGLCDWGLGAQVQPCKHHFPWQMRFRLPFIKSSECDLSTIEGVWLQYCPHLYLFGGCRLGARRGHTILLWLLKAVLCIGKQGCTITGSLKSKGTAKPRAGRYSTLRRPFGTKNQIKNFQVVMLQLWKL